MAGDDAINLASTLAWVRTLHGRPNLRWHRPRRHHIDKSRRRLATGRYADKEPHAPRFVAADPKLGFPQPPKQESLHQEPSAANKSQSVVDGGKKTKRKRMRKQPFVSEKPARRRARARAMAK